jgi:LysR family transcriptional regulator, regulator for genes of the gallate degradation pathway
MNEPTISLRSLRAVQVTADEGSVNRAARILHLSQPAVSSAIRTIEKQLSVSLFARSPTGVELTPEGVLFVQRIRRALGYLQSAEQELLSNRKNHRSSFSNAVSHRHLIAFIEAAECESLTYAARRIGVTYTAIDRSIRELEHLTGNILLERQHRRIVPTMTGGTLLRYTKLMFSELRYAKEELATRKGKMAGKVFIGCLPLSQTVLAPRAIAHLSRVYPDLEFSIADGPYVSLLSSLRCGDLDLIVGALRNPPPVNDVVEEELFSDALSIVARRDHPFFKRKSVTLADLAISEWVVPRSGIPTRAIFEQLFRKNGFAVPSSLCEASSLIAVRALLIESDRLTIISRSQIEYEERAQILDVLPIQLPATSRPIGITTRADMASSPAIEAVIRELRNISAELYDNNNQRRHERKAQRA